MVVEQGDVKDVGAFLFLLFAGPGLLTLGVTSLRHGWWRESVPLLEVVIDRAAGIDSPPRNRWDRWLARVQAWMFVVIGSAFSLGLVAVLISIIF